MTNLEVSQRTHELWKKSGALKKGHFELSSGLHSDSYCQCATLFEQPAIAQEVSSMIIEVLPSALHADVVLAPAIGGILWGYEVARTLEARSLFAERKPGCPFELRRGFQLNKGDKVLLAEDVVTTGKSVLELKPIVEAAGAEIVGFLSIIDRSKGSFEPGAPFFYLAGLDFQTYDPDDCPLCRGNEPITKPGSRVSTSAPDA